MGFKFGGFLGGLLGGLSAANKAKRNHDSIKKLVESERAYSAATAKERAQKLSEKMKDTEILDMVKQTYQTPEVKESLKSFNFENSYISYADKSRKDEVSNFTYPEFINYAINETAFIIMYDHKIAEKVSDTRMAFSHFYEVNFGMNLPESFYNACSNYYFNNFQKRTAEILKK